MKAKKIAQQELDAHIQKRDADAEYQNAKALIKKVEEEEASIIKRINENI